MDNKYIPIELVSIATSFSTKNGYCLILKEIGGDRKIQMVVGTSEAQSLAVYLEKIITIRPLTHHFINTVIDEFEIKMDKVLIYKYEDGIFFSKPFLKIVLEIKKK